MARQGSGLSGGGRGGRTPTGRCVHQVQTNVPGDHLEVPIHGEEGPSLSESDGGDQAVHHGPYRFAVAAAGTLDERSVLEVGETFHLEDLESGEQMLNVERRSFRGTAREQFHEDRGRRGDRRVRHYGGTEGVVGRALGGS